MHDEFKRRVAWTQLAMWTTLLLLLPQPVAAACASLVEQKILLLGDVADLQQSLELQVEMEANRGAPDGNGRKMEARYDLTDRVQFSVAAGEEHDHGTVGGRTFDASTGVDLLCDRNAMALRLDLGVRHERAAEDAESYARLVAGGPFVFGTWHAGASRGTGSATRSYFGAAILHNEFSSLALEAKRESDGAIWKTLFSAGLYLYTTDRMELALGLAQLGDDEDPRRRLMLKLHGEFD